MWLWLRSRWWWKWVGVAYGVVFILWPTAAFAARVIS